MKHQGSGFLITLAMLTLILSSVPVNADFLETEIVLHPTTPVDGPFIIEINGSWSTDCHPGEQRPFIDKYDGESVVIKFEIVVVHVTCNDSATPYRTLVDMSGVVGSVNGAFDSLKVKVDFDGERYTETLPLTCADGVSCGQDPVIRPDSGLFSAEDLNKQGILLSRQEGSMASYPLIYDEDGKSEWLIGGGRLSNDTFFAELFSFSGGSCPNCEISADPPEQSSAGGIAMLFDAPDRIQVKIGDGQFFEYLPFVFGYARITSDANPEGMVDLSGRWAAESIDIRANGGGSPFLDERLPLVFDLHKNPSSDPSDETASYTMFRLIDRWMAELTCDLGPPVSCEIEIDGIGGPYPVTLDSYRSVTIGGDTNSSTNSARFIRLE